MIRSSSVSSDDCPLRKYLEFEMENKHSHNLENLNSMSEQYNAEIEFHEAVEINILDPCNMKSVEGGEVNSLNN
jgi:hypothetical protein